ncbi:uncharacterized protein Z520_01698 [Fonsecaea multimorphosa CBS 102226]|uniref:UDENN FLCN/SMCR8-type domain-containing protein n=1 Tax=Fonsecaea multimorphosa CBS 102226 TaxID=1442371 RepID=A0A0D2HN10_9EURO|nr:uncharacterized protein Z520_01698 [Fonsecaea multimorphosa CBS 102226]KIY03231.1 hypothetical protein Z520_01698 [Fonsecaea multimorphosa CBS 102226]OAL30470.1 hypothetical protein AYO22_01668 [Fonsecaea multimorphosa]
MPVPPAAANDHCAFVQYELTLPFQLALTHFCEAHGPKSVLCTQVLPLECALCLPPSPPLRASSSTESLATQVHNPSLEASQNLQAPPSLRKTDTNSTWPTDISGASTAIDSETEPESPTIEKHPLFQPVDQSRTLSSQWRYGRNQDETCASCSFSVPKAVAEKLPVGAPGSKRANHQNNINTGAPVLRSREFVCLREKKRRNSSLHVSDDSKPSSYGSSVTSSGSSHATSHLQTHRSDDCHDHTLTYLTAKSPADRESYAQLRASVIRTLSCELLPRGMSDGPFCFGDSNTGYTIAYVFRLTDPKARGRRRAYAFLALAGKDASRAFEACPMLWESFARMAKGIETAAQKQRLKEEKEAELDTSGKSTARNYTPVSSFLTARTVDPDGHPRRVGQATPRSLAEIVGDENIFTFLHQYFVAILRCLGERFGGPPLAENPLVYHSTSEESPRFSKADVAQTSEHSHDSDLGLADSKTDKNHFESLRDQDTTPTPQLYQMSPSKTWPLQQPKQQEVIETIAPERKDKSNGDCVSDVDLAKSNAKKTIKEKDKNKMFASTNMTLKKLTPQCAMPMAVTETAQRQVVV